MMAALPIRSGGSKGTRMADHPADVQRQHSNRLAGETSPYLLQHAHNPVYWYPWGAEALARSRQENRPIFLSIGYSACHWCHVMERESFEDPDTAALMNEHFVNVKVDREERPDIDNIYMQAVLDSGTYRQLLAALPARHSYHELRHQDAIRGDVTSTRRRSILPALHPVHAERWRVPWN